MQSPPLTTCPCSDRSSPTPNGIQVQHNVPDVNGCGWIHAAAVQAGACTNTIAVLDGEPSSYYTGLFRYRGSKGAGPECTYLLYSTPSLLVVVIALLTERPRVKDVPLAHLREFRILVPYLP